MSSEEENEERWSEVDEDVFEVEQSGEHGSAEVEIILRDSSSQSKQWEVQEEWRLTSCAATRLHNRMPSRKPLY